MNLNRQDIIGYIRVSTQLQAQDPQALKAQNGKLLEACARNRFILSAVYEDVGSAADPGSAWQRPGLIDAIKHASASRSNIIVTDVQRLFRNPDDARNLLSGLGVRIFTVKENRFLTLQEVYDRAAHGANQVANIRAGTSLAKIAQGATGPTKEEKARGRARSLITRKAKADDRIESIKRLLRMDPAYEALTYQAFADLLNRNGITTARGKKWTKVNVRDDVGRAKDELEIEQVALPSDHSSSADMNDLPWFANMF